MMGLQDAASHQAFDRDAALHGGYRYTTEASLSSRLANARLSDAVFAAVPFKGKRVIDLGCGDGTYTAELSERGEAEFVGGLDLAQLALKLGRRTSDRSGIAYAVSRADILPLGANSADIVHLRGVLHHVGDPLGALRDAFRVARTIIVVEPNGLNPGLKVLEKTSTYHKAHGEKSYTPSLLRRWIVGLGGRIIHEKLVGFVPMFCPDWLARAMKAIEPLVESIPLIRELGTAVCVIVAVRDGD